MDSVAAPSPQPTDSLHSPPASTSPAPPPALCQREPTIHTAGHLLLFLRARLWMSPHSVAAVTHCPLYAQTTSIQPSPVTCPGGLTFSLGTMIRLPQTVLCTLLCTLMFSCLHVKCLGVEFFGSLHDMGLILKKKEYSKMVEPFYTLDDA